MIPSLTRDTSLVQRTPDWLDWPPPATRVTGALFEERPALRKLVVLADANLLAAVDDSTLSQKVLLTGLLAHPYIKALRYRDEGPPAGTPRRSYGPPEAGLSAAEGWAELLPPDRGGVYGAQYIDGPLIQHRRSTARTPPAPGPQVRRRTATVTGKLRRTSANGTCWP